MTDLHVDLSDLEQVGRSLQVTAQQLGNMLPGHDRDAVAPSGTGQPGWTAWAAMAQVGRAWADELAEMATELADAGQKAIDATGVYAGADRDSAAGFGRIR